MSNEIYKRYRPKMFKQVVGQDEACRCLQQMLKRNALPHAILFTGPSGCGKTTLARIIKSKIDCSNSDFKEINCADFRGVDTIREVRSRMTLSPIGGKTRVVLIDEAHQLSKDAQNALLKMLEDTPTHVYFMLATTDPGKLIGTIINRCTEVRVKALTNKYMQLLLKNVCEAEGIELSEVIIDGLIKFAEGSARKALVMLDQLAGIKDDEDAQLNLIASADVKRQGIELARGLMNPRVRWPEIAKILKGIDEDPEQIRYLVMNYATSVMLGGGKLLARANLIANAFRDNFFDSKKAGLVMACFEVVGAK